MVSAVEHFENLCVLMQRLQDKGIRYRQENRRWSRISKFFVYSSWVFVVWIQGGDPTESAGSSSTDILQLGHFGVQRMKQLACTAVYWPRIDEDIVRVNATGVAPALSTRTDLRNRRIIHGMLLKKPWSRIHLDDAVTIMWSN